MIIYLDTSALVKKYVEEARSHEVRDLLTDQTSVATCAVSRAEAAAAFSRSVTVRSLTASAAREAHRDFVREWKTYIRIRVTEALVARADGLAWTHKLRGYDAVHLAAALEWQDRIGEIVTLGTFDNDLWMAAAEAGIERFPSVL